MSDRPEQEPTAQDAEHEVDEQLEDVELDEEPSDEVITERVRGGRRAISIPY